MSKRQLTRLVKMFVNKPKAVEYFAQKEILRSTFEEIEQKEGISYTTIADQEGNKSECEYTVLIFLLRSHNVHSTFHRKKQTRKGEKEQTTQ